jgi:hypothetical protein
VGCSYSAANSLLTLSVPRTNAPMKAFHVVACFLAAVFLASCVSLQDASPREVQLASGAPSPGKAKLFVYRPSRLLSGAIVHRVYVDGRLLGSTASGTFLVTEIEPGRHMITAGADQHELNAVAGQTYYYNQTVWYAMYDPSTATGLEQVSESVGREGVRQCKQASANF